MVRGRDVTAEDSANAPRTIWINDALARRYFPGEDPIGHKIVWNGHCTIAGMTLVISTNIEPSSITGAVRSAIQSVDPVQPVFGIKTMERVVSDSLSNQRLYAWLLGVFAGLALLLASAGIYGVMSYLVTQRTQEFGVRMALGAAKGDVLRMVLRQALLLIAGGVVIGLAGAFAVTRVLSNFLYGVKPVDLPTFAGVSAVLIVVALVATYLPARRATKVDPMVALRYE